MGVSTATQDAIWMQQAFKLAQRAAAAGEVPVGAILVRADKIIAQGWNQSIALHDPTAHAEIVTLRAAARQLKNYRIVDATLYVTLEPCAMCAGAIVQARIKNLVYATPDPKAGAVASVFAITSCASLNHQVHCRSGVLQQECSTLLKDFFQARRSKCSIAESSSRSETQEQAE